LTATGIVLSFTRYPGIANPNSQRYSVDQVISLHEQGEGNLQEWEVAVLRRAKIFQAFRFDGLPAAITI
jgi:hypothetical protein